MRSSLCLSRLKHNFPHGLGKPRRAIQKDILEALQHPDALHWVLQRGIRAEGLLLRLLPRYAGVGFHTLRSESSQEAIPCSIPSEEVVYRSLCRPAVFLFPCQRILVH